MLLLACILVNMSEVTGVAPTCARLLRKAVVQLDADANAASIAPEHFSGVCYSLLPLEVGQLAAFWLSIYTA